jgi:hypothetical protein
MMANIIAVDTSNISDPSAASSRPNNFHEGTMITSPKSSVVLFTAEFIDQNVVGLQLTVETRACRPVTAIAEELNDLIGRSRQHDNLRDEPRRVRGGMLYKIDCSVEDVLFSH